MGPEANGLEVRRSFPERLVEGSELLLALLDHVFGEVVILRVDLLNLGSMILLHGADGGRVLSLGILKGKRPVVDRDLELILQFGIVGGELVDQIDESILFLRKLERVGQRVVLSNLKLQNQVFSKEAQIVDVVGILLVGVDQVGDVLGSRGEFCHDIDFLVVEFLIVDLKKLVLGLSIFEKLRGLVQLLLEFEGLSLGKDKPLLEEVNSVFGHDEHVQRLLEEPVSIVGVLSRLLDFREVSVLVHVMSEDGVGGLLPPVDTEGPVEAHFFPDPLAVLFEAVEEFVLVQSVDPVGVVPAALPADISFEVAAILLSNLFLTKIRLNSIDGLLGAQLFVAILIGIAHDSGPHGRVVLSSSVGGPISD